MAVSLLENRRMHDQVLIKMRLPNHEAPLSFASQETMSRQFRHFHQHGRISGGRSASLAQNEENFGPVSGE
jgi:hypothetical protein